MNKLLLTTLFVACTHLCLGAPLPRSTPEAQGVSSAAILDFVSAADAKINSLHSFMLVRHGRVVAEGWWAPYDAPSRHVLYSLSKSFASTAVGLAVADGKLSVDDEVLKFFPEDAPAEPSNNLKAMRVRDLLRMNTGHETEPPRPPDQSWKKSFLSHPVRYKPGTHFLYNTSGTYMLAAIVEKVTGKPLMDYLQPRLFGPLGIENPTWDKSPEGVTIGGFGLSVRTEDIARFGQLYLQRGQWQGRQLLPAAWVDEASGFQTANGSNPKSDWEQGYGYQFWRCRNGAYRGDGAFGQYCVVLPQQDAVIAITGGLGDMQGVMNLIWEKLLPGFATGPLKPQKQDQQKLAAALKGLALRPVLGPATSTVALGRKYQLPENPRNFGTLALAQNAVGSTTLILQMNGAEHRIECGHGTWKKGAAPFAVWGAPERPQPIAASGAWTAEDTFTASICLTEAPFVYTLSLQFVGEELRFNCGSNVGFGPTKDRELTAKSVLP